MSIERYLIDGLGVQLTSSNTWGKLQAFAHEIEDPTITHQQKKILMLSAAERAGIDIAEDILDMLVAMALARLGL